MSYVLAGDAQCDTCEVVFAGRWHDQMVGELVCPACGIVFIATWAGFNFGPEIITE